LKDINSQITIKRRLVLTLISGLLMLNVIILETIFHKTIDAPVGLATITIVLAIVISCVLQQTRPLQEIEPGDLIIFNHGEPTRDSMFNVDSNSLKLTEAYLNVVTRLNVDINQFTLVMKRGSYPSAVAFGLGKGKSIWVSAGFVAKLSANELESVIAHEIGHLVHHDALETIIIFCTFAILIISFIPAIVLSFFSREDILPILIVISFLPTLLILPFLLRLYEFHADAYAASLGFGFGLSKCLFRNAYSHQHIFDTHPSNSARLDALRQYWDINF
jgi:Zn-dependent protease with chaperone function